MAMIHSTKDDIMLCYEVGKRLIELRDKLIRTTGNDLIVPESLRADMIRMNRLAGRYKRDDYRHRDSEKKAVKVIAQWTLDLNCAICGQPSVVLQWKD